MNAGSRGEWTPVLLVLLLIAAAGVGAIPANLRMSDPPAPTSPDPATDVGARAGQEALESWNLLVPCTADVVTIEEVLGPAHPSHALNGTPYQRTATLGGTPHPRDLTPPCTITNVSGQARSALVQIDGVYLESYGLQTMDCSAVYKNVNGGRPYPNNETFCDQRGRVFTVGTRSGFLEIEVDQDWRAAGYCGPGVPSCDDVALADAVSNGTISLDVQGFVFWDGENWELHPFTGWRLSPPPGFNPPRGIHLSYLDDPTTAVVTWHTMSPETSRVDWGTTAGGPYPSSAVGTDYTSPGGSFLHAVTLTDLTPGTRYHYRAGNATMDSASDEASFRAAPANGSADGFTFAAAGDWGNSIDTAATSLGILARDPDLVVSLGDHYYSPNETIVKRVFEKWGMFGRGSFVQQAMGDREYGLSNTSHTPTNVHCAFVNLPGNERTYAFTFGDTFFLTIDWGPSSKSLTDGVDGRADGCAGVSGTQAVRSWVDARLAEANADPDITWKIVFQHFQCYDVTTDPYFLLCPDGSQTVDQMEDLLTDRGVDLVLTAHERSYGRTHPVEFHSVVRNGSRYDSPEAPLYVVLGTGGAASPMTCRTEAWVAACRPMKTHGFGHFVVTPTEIRYEFVDNSAGVVDAFTLTKAPSDFAVAASPASLRTVRDGTATARVDVTGFSADPVALSVSGCPANTACTLSPETGLPSFASTLRIETTSSSPAGEFDLVITATNATASRTATLSLEIVDVITLTFRDGDGGPFSETDDTYISSGFPDTNFGTALALSVDGSGCKSSSTTVCKALIKFPSVIGAEPGQVPLGALIANASLELNITNTGFTQDVYQITESWDEATATWNRFDPPGEPGTRSLDSVIAPRRLGAFSINLTTIVQRWADGEANEGILLASAHTDGVDYASSESSNRPKLTVSFVPSKGPPARSFRFGAVGNLAPPGNTDMEGLSKRLAATDASFLLALGDLSYVGNESAWCSSIKSGIDDVLVLGGNHDEGAGEGDIAKFVEHCPFTLDVPVHAGPDTPGYGYEYYFDYPAADPLARFLLLSPGLHGPLDVDYTPGSPHWDFVVDAVRDARANGIRWVVAGAHKPCVNVGELECDMGQALFDALVTLKVDVILQAHTHTYQRSKGLAHGPACASIPSDGAFDGDCIADDGADGTYDQWAGTVVVTNGVGGHSFHGVPLDGSDPELGYVVHAMGVNGNTKGMTKGFGSVVFTVTNTSLEASTDYCPSGTTDPAGQCPSESATVFRDGFTILAGGTPPSAPVETLLASEPTSPDPSHAGHEVALAAVLTDREGGTPLVGKGVDFEASEDVGETWWSAGTGITDSDGRAGSQVVFDTPGDKLVRAIFAGDADTLPGVSAMEAHTVLAEPTTLTFQKGDGGAYSETDDAFITSSRPTTRFGANAALRVDATDCTRSRGICRSLIMFPDFIGPNTGQVPAGSTIESATLELRVTDPGGTQSLYQVTEAWTEGDVTWNSFAVPGSPGTKGAAISFAAPAGAITVNVTRIVQAWVDGDANFGMFLRTDSANLVVFGSSESSTRPRLTVTLLPPGAPPMGGSDGSSEASTVSSSLGSLGESSFRTFEARTREIG